MCERYIDQLPLTCPQVETWPATQVCALTRNRTGDLSVHRPCTQCTERPHPARASSSIVNADVCISKLAPDLPLLLTMSFLSKTVYVKEFLNCGGISTVGFITKHNSRPFENFLRSALPIHSLINSANIAPPVYDGHMCVQASEMSNVRRKPLP